jgi:hypothetical protein
MNKYYYSLPDGGFDFVFSYGHVWARNTEEARAKARKKIEADLKKYVSHDANGCHQWDALTVEIEELTK